MSYTLRYSTSTLWVDTVISNFDRFLIDHAAAEKKAAGMAISMLSHYPDKPDIVKAMIDLSIEEMLHFRDVVKYMAERGLQLEADKKDVYVNKLRKLIRNGSDAYMLDRLLIGSVIESRGCERFGLIAEALPAGELKKFYKAITESEARHDDLFLNLAKNYFPEPEVMARLSEILNSEAEIISTLPIVSALH